MVVKTLNTKIAITILVLFFINPSFVQALQLSASLYSKTEYTTNARLESINTEDDVIERVGVNVLLNEERKRFNANARFNIYQEFYLNNTFSDQTQLTTGFGLFNFDIVEEFLDWRTSFTRTDVLSDAAAVDTVDNREQRNTFRTGPTINYRMNQSSTVRLGANYVQVINSDEGAADTKRVDANASYIYQYNSITDFSLNSNYDRVIEVKENGQTRSNSNEHLQNASLNVGMNRQFSYGSFSAKVGRNEVRSEDRETVSGNFFNIQLEREQVFYHSVLAKYSESVSDSSIGFGSFEDLITANPDLSPASPILEVSTQLDIIKQKRANVSIKRNIDSYEYSISAFWIDLNYDIQNNDERSIGLVLNLRQNIQDGLTAGFTYRQVNQELIDRPGDGDNVTQTYTIDSAYRWTKDFSTNGFVAYESRENNKQALREYEDFSVGVTLKWDLY
tara:strand:- start:3053 stop:4396 length:1344 start_codon:yes stop_codon:yes gene_type:complete